LLASRPFYTAPRGGDSPANNFDLLFQGMEITTGGQRLHRREDLEQALRGRGIDPNNFESHLKVFDLGMPPQGGFAIGLERLTSPSSKPLQRATGSTLSLRQVQIDTLTE
jgi:nondiscriminating aspartyl-tRNA synthetase